MSDRIPSRDISDTKNSSSKLPEVAILMATYNGELYLQEQLDSFARQTNPNWVLWATDDGSSDNTLNILHAFAAKFPAGKVNIVNGPQIGFADNFLSLIHNSSVRAKYFAYADQDDVWLDNKLERAITFLQTAPNEIPALYCSRTEYVDENLNHIGYSQKHKKPAAFSNALVQNIASGNTMVFNSTARSLLSSYEVNIKIPLHDWWTYMVITAYDGKVYFDHRTSIKYRQHADNLWGMNTSLRSRFRRIKKLFEGRFSAWNDMHITALSAARSLLPKKNQKTLELLIKIRGDKVISSRLRTFKQSGLFRQSALGNLGLRIAVFFRKI